MSLKSYNTLYNSLECNPNATVECPPTVLLQESILRAMNFQPMQVCPFEAVLEIFVAFTLNSDTKAQDLFPLLN